MKICCVISYSLQVESATTSIYFQVINQPATTQSEEGCYSRSSPTVSHPQYYASKSQPEQCDQGWTAPVSDNCYWSNADTSAISDQNQQPSSSAPGGSNSYYSSEEIKYLVTDLSDCLKTETWIGSDQFYLPDQENSYTFL